MPDAPQQWVLDPATNQYVYNTNYNAQVSAMNQQLASGSGYNTPVTSYVPNAPVTLQGSVSYTEPTGSSSVVNGATAYNSGYTAMTPTYGTTTPTTTLQGSTELGQANYPSYPTTQQPPPTGSQTPTTQVNVNPNGSVSGAGGFLPYNPYDPYGVYGSLGIAAPGNTQGYYLQPSSTQYIGGTNPGTIGAFNPSLYPNGISTLQTNPNDPGSLQYLQAQAAATAAANPAPDARFLPGGMYYGQNPATVGVPITGSVATAINQNPSAYPQTVVNTANTTVNGGTSGVLQGGVTNNYYLQEQQLTPQQQLVQDVQQNMFAAMDSGKHNVQMPNIPNLPSAIQPFGEMPGASKFNPSQIIAQDPGGAGYPGMQQAQYDNQPSNPYQGGLNGPAPGKAQPPQGQQPPQQPPQNYGFPSQTRPGAPGFDPNNANNALGAMWHEQYLKNQGIVLSPGQKYQIPPPPQPKGLAQRIWQGTANPAQLQAQARGYQNLVDAITAHNKAVDERASSAATQNRQLLESAMTMQNTGNRIAADQAQEQRKQQEISDAEYRQAHNDFSRNFPTKGVEQDAAIMRQMREWKGRTKNGQPIDITDWANDYPYDQANLRGKDDRHQAALNARALFDARKSYAEHQASLIGKRDRDYDDLMKNKNEVADLNKRIKEQQLASSIYKLSQDRGIKTKLNEDKHALNQAKLVELKNQATDKLRVTANQTIGRYTDLLKAMAMNPDLVGEENKGKLEAYLKTTYGADGLVRDGAGGLMPKAVIESFRTLGDTPEKIQKMEREFGQTINQIRQQAGQTEQIAQATKALNPSASNPSGLSIQSFRNQEQKKIESAFGKSLDQLRSSNNPKEKQAVQMFDQRTGSFGSAPASNLAPIAAPAIKKKKSDNLGVETINVSDEPTTLPRSAGIETVNLTPIRPKKKAQ